MAFQILLILIPQLVEELKIEDFTFLFIVIFVIMIIYNLYFIIYINFIYKQIIYKKQRST